MQVRMGIALMVVVAMFAVGCANKQQKQASRENKVEQAEAKRQREDVKRQQKAEQEQAQAEQKRQQAEAKRMAAEDKRRREEDRRLAEKKRQEEAKYEREQRIAFASDIIQDERNVRAIDRFAQASAASGAREDLMLNDAHFDGGELNALGRGKVALVARSAPAGSEQPVVIYVGGVDDAAAQPRIAAVQAYWQGTPHADLKLEIHPGMNDVKMTPAASGIAGLRKMDRTAASGSTVAGSASGSGSTSSGTTGTAR